MTWTISEKGMVYDVVEKRIDGKAAFDIVPHRMGSRYPSYSIGQLANAVGEIAARKYYWGIKYFDHETGELKVAKRKNDYCNAFLSYVLSGIGPILPFPQSKQWDALIKAKIQHETLDIEARHKYFRKVSRKRRARAETMVSKQAKRKKVTV